MGILTCLFFYFDIQKQSVDSCCSPLQSMPPLLGAGLLHCRVLVFFLPLQEDHVAQQLQLPSMAMTAGQSRALGHLWQCVWPFRFPKNSREMTSWGMCSGVDGWWVRTFAPLSHLAAPPTVADWTHAVTPGAWRERLDERMNLLSKLSHCHFSSVFPTKKIILAIYLNVKTLLSDLICISGVMWNSDNGICATVLKGLGAPAVYVKYVLLHACFSLLCVFIQS